MIGFFLGKKISEVVMCYFFKTIMIMMTTLVVFLLPELLKNFLAASIEEKRIVDAINKQKNEVKRQQEEIMSLLDRIIEEIEKCPEGR